MSVVAARLIPFVPFTALNDAAGLTSLRLCTYLLGTGLGMVPGTLAYVTVGAYSTSIVSRPFIAAVIGLVLSSVIGGAAQIVRRRRKR